MSNMNIDMKGQVFTVAKIHYINGVVYFIAPKRETDLSTLAENYLFTTKSGNVKQFYFNSNLTSVPSVQSM